MNYSDSDSDSNYNPIQDSSDDVSDSDSDFSSHDECSDDEVQPRLAAGTWKFIGAGVHDDERATPLIEVNSEYDFHPGIDFEDMKSARHCFEAFFGACIKYLCLWTNKRALLYFAENAARNNKVYGVIWNDVMVEEMYVFFALVFLMGVTHCPSITDYWSKSVLVRGPPCFCAKVMSRNRFLSILKFLRFSDPELARKNTPLTRLGQYMALLREVSQLLLDPGEHCAVDECLMLYKGRLHFRQFIKDKRARFGLKLFCLCPSDPQFRGYTWNFALYIGKDLYDIHNIPEAIGLSMSERVVVYLAESLLNQGRHIIVDNWYMSVRLTDFLLSKQTYITGTIRKNRGVPVELTNEALVRGQTCFLRDSDKLLMRFRDKKDVYVLTSRYTAGFSEKLRHVGKGKREYILKPEPIEQYNLHMGGVDATDQDLHPYNPARKSYSWFKKFGIHLAGRMLLNARVLHQRAHQKEEKFLSFIVNCCHELLENYSPGYQEIICETQSDSRPVTPMPPGPVHCLVPIPSNDKKKRPQKRCRVCSSENVRKDTRKMCSVCEGQPGLCGIEHFNQYHQ